MLFAAIINLVPGVLIISDIGVSMTVLPFMLGIWVLFSGISMLSFSGVAKETDNKAFLIIGGILNIILAFQLKEIMKKLWQSD